MIMRRSLTAIAIWLAIGVVAIAESQPAEKSSSPKDANTLVLFDGKTLKGWELTNFGGEGEVKVEDGSIVLDFGSDMTGITWTKSELLPKSNYEITLEGQRVDGGDFFCGLTFEVNKAPCTLILGGWGGGVVGLSSLNGLNASENETTLYREFKTGQWYKIRLRVTDGRIQAWLDDKEVIDADIRDKKLSIRSEVELSRPLGFATWRTKGALRNIKLRKLDSAEIKAATAAAK